MQSAHMRTHNASFDSHTHTHTYQYSDNVGSSAFAGSDTGREMGVCGAWSHTGVEVTDIVEFELLTPDTSSRLRDTK